jgi:hypothetical protein
LSAEGLALHQGELLAFERRLAALEPAAHDLEGNHRPALRQRLSAIRTELQGKIVALQQTHARNVVDEEIGKEARCRSDMEALYREFCASNDALWASRGQWGLTAQQLAAQMKVVADFDKRFSDFQLIGSTLKTGGDAFLARLAVLQQDVKGVSRVLGEMYASRIASDNNVAGIVAAGNQAAFESLTNINKGWRKTFKME